MATCSFLKATDAKSLSRNNAIVWGEICELQTAILAAIAGDPCATPPVLGAFETLVTDGTPFTSLNEISAATLVTGGTGFTVETATATIDGNGTGGTGALYTPLISSAGVITGFTQVSKGSGYAPISATAVVGALYDLIDAQDETNYDGVSGNGLFTSGATYRVGEVISLSEGSTATVDTQDGTAGVVQTALQDETDFNGLGRQIVDVGGSKAIGTATGLANDATVYTATIEVNGGGAQAISIVGSAAQTYADLLTELTADTTNATWSLDPATGNLRAVSNLLPNNALSTIDLVDTDLFSTLTGFVAIDAAITGDNIGLFNGGDGAGATTYVVGTTIRMSDGSVLTIYGIDGNGDVTQFIITSGSTSSFASTTVLSQQSADAGGLGFTLTPKANNEISVGSVTGFTIASAGTVPFTLPSIITQASSSGIGTGFTLTPEITNNAVYAGGQFLSNNYTSLAFNDANPDTIVRTGGTAFDVDAVVLAPGDTIRIASANTPANDGVYTVFTVTATTITLIGADTLTVDAADATATIQRVAGTDAILTPIVTNGVITNVVINSPGTGYLLNQPILFTHPSGASAAATITALDGSQGIAAITISNGGSGYATVSPTVSITHPTGFGFEGTAQIEARDALITVTAAGGAVTAATLVDGGVGYANGTGFSLTITDTTLAGDANATLTYDVVNGAVTNVAVGAGGSGYSPAINILVNPVDVPDSEGAIAGISIQDGGSLYGDVYPTIVVSDATGSGAEINVTGVSGGAITSIQLADGGSNYSATPSLLYYYANGTQATANLPVITLTVDTNTFGTTPFIYYSVLSGQSSDRVIQDQLQYVIDYFTALGYNIRAQVNPATNNTIQWQIIW